MCDQTWWYIRMGQSLPRMGNYYMHFLRQMFVDFCIWFMVLNSRSICLFQTGRICPNCISPKNVSKCLSGFESLGLFGRWRPVAADHPWSYRPVDTYQKHVIVLYKGPDNQKNTAHMGLYKNTPKQSKTIVPNKSFPQRITMEGQWGLLECLQKWHLEDDFPIRYYIIFWVRHPRIRSKGLSMFASYINGL